jgi:hypothetical protein
MKLKKLYLYHMKLEIEKAIGQKILFKLPYFENYLYFEGEIVSINNTSLKVTYKTCHDGNIYRITTDLQHDSIIN